MCVWTCRRHIKRNWSTVDGEIGGGDPEILTLSLLCTCCMSSVCGLLLSCVCVLAQPMSNEEEFSKFEKDSSKAHVTVWRIFCL